MLTMNGLRNDGLNYENNFGCLKLFELFVCIGDTHFFVFSALMGITACAKYPTFCF